MSRKANDAKTTRKARKAAIKKATASRSKTVVNQIVPNFTFIADNLPPLPEISDKSLLAASLDRSCPEHQRLAFLGDRVFEVGAMKAVWNSCSSARVLNDAKQKLTTNLAFSQIADAYNFRERLNLVKPAHPNDQVKALGTALEARLGASYLDAWNENEERNVIRWAAEVLSVKRWKGMREFLQLAEENDGKKRIYPIDAKGDIWANAIASRPIIKGEEEAPEPIKQDGMTPKCIKPGDQVQEHIKPDHQSIKHASQSTDVNNPSAFRIPQIFLRMFGVSLPTLTSRTYDHHPSQALTPKATTTFGDLLKSERKKKEDTIDQPTGHRKNRLNFAWINSSVVEKTLPTTTASNSSQGTQIATYQTPRVWVLPAIVPQTDQLPPLLLPMDSEISAVVMDRSTPQATDYVHEGYNLLKQPVYNLTLVHHDPSMLLFKTRRMLRSNITLSHIARYYGFDSNTDQYECSQGEAARRFLRYICVLSERTNKDVRWREFRDWSRKIYSKEVWPDLKPSSSFPRADDTPSVAVATATEATSLDAHHEQVAIPESANQSVTDHSSDLMIQTLQDRLKDVEKSIQKVQTRLWQLERADKTKSAPPNTKVESSQDLDSLQWTKAILEAIPGKLPPLLHDQVIKLDREFLQRVKNDAKLVKNPTFSRAFKIVEETIRKHSASAPAISAAANCLLANRTISHVALHYGYAKTTDEIILTQHEAARCFRYYLASVYKNGEGNGNLHRIEAWIQELFGPKAWPRLTQFLLEEEKRQQELAKTKESLAAVQVSGLTASEPKDITPDANTPIATPVHHVEALHDSVHVKDLPANSSTIDSPISSSATPEDGSQLPTAIEGVSPSAEEVFSSLKFDSQALKIADQTQLFTLITQCVKSNGISGLYVAEANNLLSGFPSISYLTRSYGLDKNLVGKSLNQREAARVFRRYVAMSLEKTRDAGDKEGQKVKDWLGQTFSDEVWPGLKKFQQYSEAKSAKIAGTPETKPNISDRSPTSEELPDASSSCTSSNITPIASTLAEVPTVAKSSSSDTIIESPSTDLDVTKNEDLANNHISLPELATSETNVIVVGKSAHMDLRQGIRRGDD